MERSGAERSRERQQSRTSEILWSNLNTADHATPVDQCPQMNIPQPASTVTVDALLLQCRRLAKASSNVDVTDRQTD